MWSARAFLSMGAVALLLLTAACGAGLIGGIASSGGNNPQASPPELSLSLIVPLVPPANTTRTVLVANAQIAAAARLRVRIDAEGKSVEQGNATASGQGGSTLITFTLVTAPIVAALGDPSAADVPGALSVFVDDRLIASSVPIVLARQPAATLIVDAPLQERFLSPLGQRVSVRVDGLRSTVASEVQMLVTTPDPAATWLPGAAVPVVTRLCTALQFEPSDGGAPIVSALVPGSTFPTQATLVVRDAVAGESTAVLNAYYRPEVTLASRSQGPTTGGSLLTLIGTALVPYDFANGGPASFRFDDVLLSFVKSDRVTELPRADLRIADSGSDRLRFTMPPSPDGRPGPVEIVLRVPLGGVTAQVSTSVLFLFANPDPFFGPRGIVLDRLPVAVAPIALDLAPSTAFAPDFAALTDQGGVAFVQLLLAQQNGMFQAFAAPLQIGNHEVAAERGPRDLAVGDFNGDGIPDLFVANEGAATAVHHLVLGQVAPLPPFGAVHRVPAAGGTWLCRTGFFDADTLPDVLLVPGAAAPLLLRPQVLLARPLASGVPSFSSPMEVPVDAFPYEAVEVADLDGDGKLDVAVVSGTQGKLHVAYGIGDGTFTAAALLPFAVPGYAVDVESSAVGLHACRDGLTQSLGLVLAGRVSLAPPVPTPTPPTVTVLRVPDPANNPRVYAAPTVADTYLVLTTPTEPIGRSLVADLDGVSPIEMVVAIRGEPQLISLGLLQLSASAGFQPILGTLEGAIFSGAEFPRQIRALVFDRAFPATPLSAEAKAVFLVHETEIDGERERRLSTRLIRSQPPGQPKLLPPDAVAETLFRIEGLVSGNFHPESAASGGGVRDLALAHTVQSGSTDSIELVANDGFGGFASVGNLVDFPGLLPNSIMVLPAPVGQIDSLLFLDRDSHLGVWRNAPIPSVQSPNAVSAPLKNVITDPLLASTDLANSTCARMGDVDGDGFVDMVVLLSFALASPGEGQAAVALLRGRPFVLGELPFHLPTAVAMVHGNASAIELGDFTRAGPGAPRRLELAVAVPVGTSSGLDGNHVRFLRYEAGATPADDRFVQAAVAGAPQVLLAGSNPTQLAAADFDGNGTIDLLVASRGDPKLRLYRNSAPIDPIAVAVHIEDFAEGAGSPWDLAAGMPTQLRLTDANGDGNLDAAAFVEFTSAVNGQRSTTVAFYYSTGAGSFDGPRYISPTRLGNRNAHLSGDLGDWNRDGLPDLLLGWDTALQLNVRVLFGGTR